MQEGVKARQETNRSVPLKFVATREEGLGLAIDAARNGQAVLYIRNTVADAMETFESVPADIQAHLFHARFAMCDRQRIQSDAINRFLGDVLVEGHEQASVQRRGGQTIRFSIVDVTGILTIADPILFSDRLRQGFGPAKAWGCGLMLCKRIIR